MKQTLQQIKDQVAQRMGFSNWKRFEQFVTPTSAIVDEVAILYANAKLDEAADGQTAQCSVEGTQESIRSFKDKI